MTVTCKLTISGVYTKGSNLIPQISKMTVIEKINLKSNDKRWLIICIED